MCALTVTVALFYGSLEEDELIKIAAGIAKE